VKQLGESFILEIGSKISTKKNTVKAKSGDKMSWEKKVRMRKEQCVEKLGKHLNFYTKQSDLTHAYHFNMPMILLLYKKMYFNCDDLNSCVLMLLKFFCGNFRVSFLKRSLMVCHQFKRLNTNWFYVGSINSKLASL
jgi:hypothetical protein